jgi:hypothetical protein
MASTMTKIVGGTIARIAMQRLATPFGFHSTATEVAAGVDLTGKRVIVTGGAAGIGIETVRTQDSPWPSIPLHVSTSVVSTHSVFRNATRSCFC